MSIKEVVGNVLWILATVALVLIVASALRVVQFVLLLFVAPKFVPGTVWGAFVGSFYFAVVIGISLLYLHFRDIDCSLSLPSAQDRRAIRVAVVGAIGVVALLIVSLLLGSRLPMVPAFSSYSTSEAVQDTTPGLAGTVILVYSPSLALLLVGVVMGTLRRVVGNGVSVLLTCLLYCGLVVGTAASVIPPIPMFISRFPVVPVSIVFPTMVLAIAGVTYERSRNIWPPTVAFVVFYALSIAVIALP